MTPLDVLARAEAAGLMLRVQGDSLEVGQVGPDRKLTPELRADLKAHEGALVNLLGGVHDKAEEDGVTCGASGCESVSLWTVNIEGRAFCHAHRHHSGLCGTCGVEIRKGATLCARCGMNHSPLARWAVEQGIADIP